MGKEECSSQRNGMCKGPAVGMSKARVVGQYTHVVEMVTVMETTVGHDVTGQTEGKRQGRVLPLCQEEQEEMKESAMTVV